MYTVFVGRKKKKMCTLYSTNLLQLSVNLDSRDCVAINVSDSGGQREMAQLDGEYNFRVLCVLQKGI